VKTLLLVEDDENDIFFMSRALKVAGITHPLQVVQDGQSALDYLLGAGSYSDRQKFPLPSLVLLDLQLPFLTGFEVLHRIRTHQDLQTLNVAILTSSSEEKDIDRAYRAGANAYLVKPGDAEKLLELVRSVDHFWLKLNHPAPHWKS
jgi:CheY-like chemotaxis protein